MLFSDTPITGLTQDDPILPTGESENGWTFEEPIPGLWYDPPLASGFTYSLVDGEFFSVTTPLGLGFSSVDVTTIDGVLATLAPGDSFNFSAGVDTFSLIGLSPLLDVEDPNFASAYPVFLDFSLSSGALSIQPVIAPVPLPGAFPMLVGGLLALRWKRKRMAVG